MRLLKKPEKINLNERTGKLEPYRSFYLTAEEMDGINNLPKDSDGNIRATNSSESLLKEILERRGMESLLYPFREVDDWSGFCKVFDDGLFWMV